MAVESKRISIELVGIDISDISLKRLDTGTEYTVCLSNDPRDVRLFAILANMLFASGENRARFDDIFCQFDDAEVVNVVPRLSTLAA